MVRLAALLLMFVAAAANAAVIATADRSQIELNESFTLEIIVDSNPDTVPDLTVLEQDFEISGTRQMTNTTIVNGRLMQSMEFEVVLMPKRAGTLTIPPIKVGNEQSAAFTIDVREPTYQPPGEADVFITAEVDQDSTYVQAQVLYTIKIYRAVATRQPALREPTFSGAEVLVELAADERSYEAVLSGRAYNVVERSFAVFPQESGSVSISPARFEARVLKDGRITGRRIFSSEAIDITVNPIPEPPPEFPDAAWLPARQVTLEDAWSREPDELRAGEPISRNITVRALGQLETQIPVIEPPEVDGVNIYPDRPVLDRQLVDGGIRGIRTDQYAMIGTGGGTVTLPGMELPWWDITAGEWRVARVPERTLTILPSDDAALAPPADETPVRDSDAPTAEAAPTIVHSMFWRRIAEILTAVWLLTLFAWWWSTRPRREERAPPPVPLHKQQARHLKTARKAAVAGDAAAVRAALLQWGRLEWPDDSPRAIGELATRVQEPAASLLAELSSASYGPGGAGFDGKTLAAALRTLRAAEPARPRDVNEMLPPLMPGA